MPDIFRDDFENGTTPYINPYNIPLMNGSLAVVPTGPVGMPALNSNCLKIDTLPVASATYPGKPEAASQALAVNIPANDDVYISARILITNGIAEMMPNDRTWYVIASSVMIGYVVRVGIRREGNNNPKWCLWCRGLGTHRYGNTVVVPTANLIRLVVHYKASTGLYELFVNDSTVPEISVTAPEANPQYIDQVAIGADKTGASGTSYDPTGIYATQTYMDAIVIATEYPNDSVVTFPKLTVTVMVNGIQVNGVPVTLDGNEVQNSPAVFENVAPGTHNISVPQEIEL